MVKLDSEQVMLGCSGQLWLGAMSLLPCLSVAIQQRLWISWTCGSEGNAC
jgi:hypothetical protein